jgi:hypothetical protein
MMLSKFKNIFQERGIQKSIVGIDPVKRPDVSREIFLLNHEHFKDTVKLDMNSDNWKNQLLSHQCFEILIVDSTQLANYKNTIAYASKVKRSTATSSKDWINKISSMLQNVASPCIFAKL